ncbi:hypothetical protein NG798_24120 [Ancylothrix sp. C2]|uniref:hypothetical protein n=1 Tax=Ancylothrix sp. D3o TaxID=2953691 RepID=UPI0021BB540E|nr:hypothetical protein [Ancylothrix sp. D3o]MCT7952890.1 hypothetical protein [Ancylothrix sp. D3o]
MNNNPTYPIILIPEAIQETALAFPPIPQFKELAPPAPTNEPQQMNLFLIATSAIGVIAFLLRVNRR